MRYFLPWALLLIACAAEEVAIGIDLGTTMSVASRFGTVLQGGTDGGPLENENGKYLTPSVVYIDNEKGGEVLVGDGAVNMRVNKPPDVFFGIKRLLGKRFDEVSDALQEMPFKVESCPSGHWSTAALAGHGLQQTIGQHVVGACCIHRWGEVWPIEVISALVLAEVKRYSEVKVGKGPISHAIVTIPAYFAEPARKATAIAAKMAGLHVQRSIAEPTAAALAAAYKNAEANRADEVTVVVDWGGGTLDVSALRMGHNGHVDVLGIKGEYIGGEDLDRLLAQHLIDRFKQKHPDRAAGLTSTDRGARLRSKFLRAAKSAKEQLSYAGRRTHFGNCRRGGRRPWWR